MEQSPHLPALIAALAPIVSQYGYLAVAFLVLIEDFGVPAPGETTLIAAAFFAGTGQLNIFIVVAVGFLAALIGDNIGFLIGHKGGYPLVEKFGKYVFLTDERLKSAETFFQNHGGKVVIVARFIEGLRQLNGILAGIMGMRWRYFLGFNAIGAFLWTAVWSAAGYFGGSHLELFHKYEIYFTVAAGSLLVLYVLYLIFRRKRRSVRQSK
jgi:membrane protein DedA with SNARE-associated domain